MEGEPEHATFAPRKTSSKRHCSVPQCSSEERRDSELRFHKFPPEGEFVYVTNELNIREKCDRRKAWIKALKIGKPLTTSMCVCSRHFVKTDYFFPDVPAKLRFLKKTSVPSLNLPITSCKAIRRKQRRRNCHHLDKNQSEPHRVDAKRKLKPNAVPTVGTLRKKQKRKRPNADEDEVIEYIESLEAKKRLPRCVVCSRLLRESKKEFLSTVTSTTGLSLHQFLIGISDGKSPNIQDLTASDMVCFYCAHLMNYADAVEAELVKLKKAINGCLEIQSMNDEDQEILKPEFDSHIAILDEFSERVVGPGSAAEREEIVDENQGNGTPVIVIENVVSIPENSDKSQSEDKGKGVSEDAMNMSGLNTRVVDEDISLNPGKIVPPKADPDKFRCKKCKLSTSSVSALSFQLGRHLAHYRWCEFCDKTISTEDEEKLPSKGDPA